MKITSFQSYNEIWIPFTHDLAMHYGDLQVDVETPDFYIKKEKARLQHSLPLTRSLRNAKNDFPFYFKV